MRPSTDYATSSHFKTADTFGLQPVILGLATRPLLKIYLERVRPKVAPRGENPATARLFLTSKGMPDKNLGLHITRYARGLGLNLTATAIRAIIDTSVVAEHRRGNISDEMMAATFKVSGHSQATSEKYYQR